MLNTQVLFARRFVFLWTVYIKGYDVERIDDEPKKKKRERVAFQYL